MVSRYARSFGGGGAALVALLLGGCGDELCACLFDVRTHLYVTGVVTGGGGGPADGIEIAPVGPSLFDCTIPVTLPESLPNPAISGADGRYGILLTFFEGGGSHCIDLSVTDPTSGVADTVRVQGGFVPIQAPPDTVVLPLSAPAPPH